MRSREPPKLLGEVETKVDRVSNLPGHITDRILSFLPIRDAVQTSILSSKWRYKWTTIPNLVFDIQCYPNSSQDQAIIKGKLVNIIDHVLLLHTGSIHKFKLSHRDLQAVADIDRWILHFSRTSIKEFVLEIWKGQRYKIPSSLYNCRGLLHLELFNCMLKPPSSFGGFRRVKTLDFQHITLAQSAFENLIACCPSLERLTLMNFDGFSHLKISAPNLQFFDVGGVFDEVTFENTFVLSVISIGLYGAVLADHDMANICNMVKFFSHLPSIERLEVQSYFLKHLTLGYVPEKLPTLCYNLQFLQLRINFNDKKENLAALCLFRSSPNLVELEMLARPDEELSSWIDVYQCRCTFNELRSVRIEGISVSRTELEFIKFILANSPVLEKMTVKPASQDRGWDLLKQMLRFRRASVRAEIIYLDP